LRAYIERVQDGDLLDGVPKTNITCVAALGWTVQAGLEPLRQERPGQVIIAGVDIIEVIIDEIVGSAGRTPGVRRRDHRGKARRDAGTSQGSQGGVYAGVDEVFIQDGIGGWKDEQLHTGGNPGQEAD